MSEYQEIKMSLMHAAHKMRRLNMGALFIDMPQSEYFTLEALYHFQRLGKESSGTFVSELAKKMNMASSATSRLLHSLEEKGWIMREVDKNDRRNTYVRLTEKGFSVRAETSERLNIFFDGVVKKMGEDEIRRLIELWNTLADTVAEELNQTTECCDGCNGPCDREMR